MLKPVKQVTFSSLQYNAIFMLLVHQFKDYFLGLAVDWSSDIPRSFCSGTGVSGGFDTAPT